MWRGDNSAPGDSRLCSLQLAGVTMAAEFVAETIMSTLNATDKKRLEMTFCDAHGRLQTVSINSLTAGSLSRVLEEFAVSHSHSSGPVATKMPKDFAVGVGRHERVVLIRFEDDAPYGLEITQAAELGRVLVEQAEIISTQPMPLRQ
jgi:hypothetical protein